MKESILISIISLCLTVLVWRIIFWVDHIMRGNEINRYNRYKIYSVTDDNGTWYYAKVVVGYFLGIKIYGYWNPDTITIFETLNAWEFEGRKSYCKKLDYLVESLEKSHQDYRKTIETLKRKEKRDNKIIIQKDEKEK